MNATPTRITYRYLCDLAETFGPQYHVLQGAPQTSGPRYCALIDAATGEYITQRLTTESLRGPYMSPRRLADLLHAHQVNGTIPNA